jgi:gluconate 2-dehydrogenase gamma chain
VYKVSRRALLQASAAAAGAAAFAPLTRLTPEARADSGLPDPVVPKGYVYLTPAEVAFVDAAVARLIPADELGPGAHEAGVTYFLDRQLAGPYGHAQTWYMRAPFAKGTKQQGYQLHYTPAQLYRAGIKGVDDHCRSKYGGKTFAQLAAAEQDIVLKALENDQVKLGDLPGKEFFHFLQQNTMEGFLADPIYGGNRDFIGWKLIGFPGPRYNYVAEIERHGARYTLPTVGLLGRQGTKKG